MKLAKKIAISVGVLITFIAYSFQQRHDSLPSISLPKLNKSNSSTSSSSGSATIPLNSDSSSNNSQSQQNTSQSNNSGMMNMSKMMYKDGTYTGDSEDAFYGFVQVQAVIKGGKITDVVFLKYPNDRQNSVYINSQAMPYLKQEAIQAQNGNVNIITGATDTSQAFIQSLNTALAQAKI